MRKSVRPVLLLLVSLLLVAGATAGAGAAMEAPADAGGGGTAPFELPARFTCETQETDGTRSAVFTLDGDLAGGIEPYLYRDTETIPTRMEEDISAFFADFFKQIGMAEYFSQSVSHMGGGSLYGAFEMCLWETDGDSRGQYHHFFIAGEDTVYDLWFDCDVFADDEFWPVVRDFPLYLSACAV